MDFFGAEIQEINHRRTIYDEMINSGKVYNLSNEGLVEQIIEDRTYQNRENRRVFRNFFFSHEFTEMFFWKSEPDIQQKIKYVTQLFEDSDSKIVKKMRQAANWSSSLITRTNNQDKELISKNRELSKSVVIETQN